jgi:hypothetical protein
MSIHHHMPTTGQTADRFLKALTRLDFDAVERCLAPNVWFRALLPKATHESTTAAGATETYRAWFGDAKRCEVLAVAHATMPGRECLSYRFRVLPTWAPETWHEIEQVGFCRVKHGRISRIDIVCSGFQPVSETRVAAPAA